MSPVALYPFKCQQIVEIKMERVLIVILLRIYIRPVPHSQHRPCVAGQAEEGPASSRSRLHFYRKHRKPP